MSYSTVTGILRLPKYYKVEKQMTEEAMELLKVFGLEEEAETLADNLPYGKQRKLEIARALATKPKLLLLDEPAAGMNPNETLELMPFGVRTRTTGNPLEMGGREYFIGPTGKREQIVKDLDALMKEVKKYARFDKVLVQTVNGEPVKR